MSPHRRPVKLLMGAALVLCSVGIGRALHYGDGTRAGQVLAVPDTTVPVHALLPAAASPTRSSLEPMANPPPKAPPQAPPRPLSAPPRPPPLPPRSVALQAGTQGSLRYLVSGGMTRSYLAVQASHPSRRALPLVVVLHGANVTPEVEEQRTGFYPLGIEGRAVVVYPTGYAKTWNAGQHCCGLAEVSGVDDVAFVQAVVADAIRHYRIDPDRVYLVGYSNGGKMALRIACSDPSSFAAVATYGAVPLTACATGTPVPVLLAASTGDREVPYSGPGVVARAGALLPPVTQVVPTLVSRNGCSASHHHLTEDGGAVSIATWSSCQSGKPVQLVTYLGGSHFWPGSTSAATVPFGAVVAVPVQGLMWQFLSPLRH